MKNLLLCILTIMTATASANCIDSIHDLDFNSDDVDRLTELVGNKAKLTTSIVNRINNELDFECSEEQILLKTYLTRSGSTYHVALTADDSCDGGNSYGYAYDINFRKVAVIEDGFTRCL